MKKLKKLGSMFLALAMALALAIPAMATGNFVEQKEFKITIPTVEGQSARTYNVYQIFKGDLATRDETVVEDGKEVTKTVKYLSNVEWGMSAKANGDASAAAAEVAKLTADELDARIGDYVNIDANNTSNVYKTMTTSDETVTVDSAGYYLFVDVTADLDPGEAHSTYIVEVVGNVTVKAKTGTTSFEKKVKDANDSTGETSDWQDSADYDIGDTVPFQLKATLAQNVSQFNNAYQLIFHDTLSKGLTYTGITQVTVNGAPITSGWDEPVYDTTNNKLTITFPNVKTLGDDMNGAVIIVEYNAELNEYAEVTNEGNPNTAYVEFSNDPYSTATGETTPDKVIVFTYTVDINKVDEAGNALANAEFSLYKEDPTDPKAVDGWKLIKSYEAGALTTFEFKGLDDGNYKLVEDTPPAGYNKIEDIEFSIVATHSEKADEPALETLKVVGKDGVTEIGSFTVNHTTDNKLTGSISSNVENKQGVTLPETGGMGTTIFYAVGGVLVLGAVVFLVTKKRVGE